MVFAGINLFMNKSIVLPLSLSLSFLFSSHVYADVSGKVFSVHDGDTIVMVETITGKKNKVRLLGVDTPEVDFMGATQGETAILARDHLRSLLPLNADIVVKPQDNSMDSNGRLLGQIFYKGQDINLLMLRAGWGAMYFIYPFDKKLVSDYTRVSEEAVINKRGIFAPVFADGQVPYVFRQDIKGLPGTNLVGDFQTKLLKNSVDEVPVYRRVFFNSETIARSQGYRY